MLRLGLAVFALTLSACDSGPPTVNFPVDDSKPMSALTTQDLSAMCSAMLEPAKETLQMACMAQAIGEKFKVGGSEQACESKYNVCVAEFNAKLNTATCKLPSEPTTLQGCTATVGEYEVCFNDMVSAAYDLGSKLSCSISFEEMQKLASQMQSFSMPPSCKQVGTKCPKLGFTDDKPAP